MKFPRFLANGQKIGVTAPSFGVSKQDDINRFENAEEMLANEGHGVVYTPNVFETMDNGSSSKGDRKVFELEYLLMREDVGAVVAAKGGDYEFEMLPHMDWGFVEDHPKWMQGYSDNTVLLFKATAEHDIATMYCGHYGDFGMEPWHLSIRQNLEFLEGKRCSQSSFPFHETGFVERETGLEPFRDDERTVYACDAGNVKFGGRMIGGCMDVLRWFRQAGTASPHGFIDRYYDDGIVWYMETYDMDSPGITATLEALADDGWFEGVTGFVFGRPLFYRGGNYQNTVTEALADFDVPKVFGADVGHMAPRMTFINGAYCEVDVKDGGCELWYDLRKRWTNIK